MNRIIAPSLLASDFSNLQNEINMINESDATWIHLDIMDGRFVPNISFGFPVLHSIQKHTSKHLDVHLMIVEPEKYVEQFVLSGANSISVHYEACSHLHRNLQQIQTLGCLAGVAVNPHTNVDLLENIIDVLDFVCLMSVNPGFGGQKFIENTYRKIETLNNLRQKTNTSFLIEIDGGVQKNNAKKLFDLGADVLVAGSFVFQSNNPKNTISELLNV